MALISATSAFAEPPYLALALRRTSCARFLRLSASQSFLQWLTDAASAGRISRAPAAASILLCRASCRYCSDHAEKPRMTPWLQMRFIAFCASCSTRFSLSFSACIAACSSAVPVSATLSLSSSFASCSAAARFT